MNINKEDIQDFLDKTIRLVIDNRYTYVGSILSYGDDYLKFRDKYNTVHLFPYANIIHLEVLR